MEGRHSWVGDLQFRLISPSGTEITLVDQECDRARNFHLGFDDSADTGVVCPISDSSSYQPNFPLSSFNNELSAGDWTLRILDLEDFDGGSFDKWEIEICTNTSKNTVSTDDAIADVIKTYPNPIGDILFIEQQQNIKYPNYAIYNAVGAQMLSDNLGSSIDVSNLPNGLYFLQIREASKVLGFKKIIISK